MNQKWQKLLTTALCCSLLISSLNGISVLAETMVVENETTTETGETTASEDTATSDSSLNASQENETANTVASSETPTEPETSELLQKMIEEPQLPSAEDQTEATADTTIAAVEATQKIVQLKRLIFLRKPIKWPLLMKMGCLLILLK